ncbi:ABC transporter substrate-binding protein [Roseovarius nubinhibens]|uniref:Peptide ABC transporter, periplasmic peptide-binding protein n=1 Tax=Roseovarius nubinhibens (strain ATCC BAA-591 / DSM 15170 / ISM) TaxID=89187 RepID=A3SJ99_ROSNI|nr:ABC transporter substrate-binding protein [Roseovarius nubinhibens]EAP77430.1 peptide ABC transporter, periplasmic peptide-binding protein [Roseovarius nubinhibens ISM]
MKHPLESLKTRLATGSMSRRQFMRSVVATGISAAAASSVADQVMAAAPKRGGTIRIGKGHGQTTDTMNPGTAENGYMVNLLQSFHGYMTEVAPDGSLVPGVAESWEAADGGKTWVFDLRKDFTFHNGKTVSPEDVIASINHHRGEDSTSAAKPLLSSLADVRADGPGRVVFELTSGNADFPFTLSDYHIPVGMSEDGKVDWKTGVGCGAYKLDNFEPGIRADLSRNDDHWDLENRAFFDSAELLAIIDANARQSGLLTGDLDAIDKLDLKTIERIKKAPGIKVHSVPGTQHFTFEMMCTSDPYTDRNLRLALKYAINRQELVDKILFGYGVVGNDHPIGQGQRFFNKDLPQREYDPDKARFHLKEAGLDKVKIELSAADAAFAGAVDAAVLYQNSAAKAGIEIVPVREPNDGYWTDVWNVKPFTAVYWGGRPVEDLMFSTAYESGVPWNGTRWSNARFDELLVTARAELDEEKRRQMYYEMQELVNMDGGLIAPMFASYVFGTRDNVGLPEGFASNWDMDGERCIERWWFT